MCYFFWNLFCSFIIGVIYAFGEMLAKFRNAGLIFKIGWGIFYLIFNGLLSILAYLIIKEFNFDYLTYKGLEVGKILVAGGSAMVIIRSWIVSVKVNNKKEGKNDQKSDIATLAPLIDVFLHYVQKEFDREKAQFDTNTIKKNFKDLDFEKVAIALPYICSNLLVTMDAKDGEIIAKKISEIKRQPVADSIKLLNLGIVLSQFVGHDLLENLVNNIKDNLKDNPRYDNLDKLLKDYDK